MKQTTMRIVLGIIIMLGLVVSAFACTTETDSDIGRIQKYADPITEDALIGMNEDDYAKFSKHFDETMRDALPEANFVHLRDTMKRVIGDYKSKEFWMVEKQGEYTVVRYKTRYTTEPADVIVTVSFHEVEGETYLAGIWFDSPKLREQ